MWNVIYLIENQLQMYVATMARDMILPDLMHALVEAL